MFSEHLNALRSFIERNPQLMASSPNDSLVQSASPNVHQRLLNFMRPEGMSTASPLHIQQSLQAKYRSKRLLLLAHSILLFTTCTAVLYVIISSLKQQHSSGKPHVYMIQSIHVIGCTVRSFLTIMLLPVL